MRAVPEATADTAASESERVPVSTQESLALNNALLVQGRVEFPAGTPLDESVRLSVRGSTYGCPWGDPEEVQVPFTGMFSVPIERGWYEIEITLAARYVYLDGPSLFTVAKSSNGLVLSPKLGSRIVGELVPPAKDLALGNQWVGQEIKLRGWEPVGRNRGQEIEGQTATVSQDLRFEFHGLRTGVTYDVHAHPDGMPEIRREDLHLEPGSTAELSFDLHRGISIAGKIVDEDHHPLESEIHWNLETNHNSWTSPTIHVTADGSFEVPRLSAGEVLLTARSTGYLPACWASGPLSDGEERKDLLLVLRRGMRVAGRVQWKDGTPARGCELTLKQKHEWNREDRCYPLEDFEARASMDGTFEVSGLGANPCTITARSSARSSSSSRPVDTENPTFSANLENVEPGSTALLLVLDEGSGFEGIVTDDQGNAIEDFEVRAAPWVPDSFSNEPWHDATGHRFHDASGHFRMAGLTNGRFNVAVQASGYAAGTLTAVEVPSSGPATRVVLPRLAEVAGTVVDPAGDPVKGARLEIESSWHAAVFGQYSRADYPVTDAEGQFHLSDMGPGNVRLAALAEGWADSSILVINLAAAQKLDGLQLVMRRGGSLVGELRDEAGRPAAGGVVCAFEAPSNSHKTVADAEGRFAMRALTPGIYRVYRTESEDPTRVRERRESGSGLDQATIVVRDGEESRVFLGGAPRAHVRVHGVITCGRQPLGDMSVWATIEASHAWSRSTSDARGRYELTLDDAGDAEVAVGGRQLGSTSFRHAFIPNKDEFAFDIEVPMGQIAGRAIAPDGRGAAGVPISLYDPTGRGLSTFAALGQAMTDSDGRFAFTHLGPGSYTINADVHPSQRQDPPPFLSSASVTGIVVGEGARVEGIELHLPISGGVEGVALDQAGLPVINASVHARDEHGRLLTEFHNCRTDGQGRFVLDHLPPGKLRIQARDASEACQPVAVEIRSGVSVRLELGLVAGTILHVVIESADGVPVQGDISVTDQQGNEFAQGIEPLESWGFTPEEPSEGKAVGPLAPGHFTITAMGKNGGHAGTTVSLSGEGEQTVRLRLSN